MTITRFATMAALLILASLLLAGAFGLISTDISITRRPPETVRTETMYDSGARRLQLRCVSATEGLCRFKVASAGFSRVFTLRTGAGMTVAGVDPHARICSGGRDPLVEPCAATAVS